MLQKTEQWPTRKIAVYRDSPVWNKHARWFNVPIADLESLWVTEYDVRGDISSHDIEVVAKHIREEHPNCVLIY
jgi:hypothetical protein